MEGVRMDMQRMALNWRDEKYYFADGNMTILVSKTLFKVHRSILAQDQSAFEDMFAIGDDNIYVADEIDTNEEGSSDSNPIYLQGDTVDEFRDLLWALYSLPHEIIAVMTSRASIIKLANIARITNKYHFSNVEQWALHALTELYKDNNPFSALGSIRRRPLSQVPASSAASISGDSDASGQSSDSVVGTESMSTHALVQTTEVAMLSGYAPLLRVVRARWKARIGERKDLAVAMDLFARLASPPPSRPSSILTSSTISVSTLESDRQDLGDLQGLAYYTMMLQGRDVWNHDPLLTRDHRIKLLSGNHELTRLCESLEDDAPVFNHCVLGNYAPGSSAASQTQDFTEDEACDDTDACQDAWKNLWKTITKPNSDFASLLGILYRSSSSSSIRSASSSASANALLAGAPTPSRDGSGSKADFLGKYMFAISVLQALVEGTISREGLMVYDLNEACSRRGLEAARAVLERFRRGLTDFFGDVV